MGGPKTTQTIFVGSDIHIHYTYTNMYIPMLASLNYHVPIDSDL